MVTQSQIIKPQLLDYPDSDGQPMANNTLQFEWVVRVKENLERLFAKDPNVFVAGDLLWYPIEGDNKTRVAPDAMVVFGRPKGYRGSYKQWEEQGIPPQVVFEILSPGNRLTEMLNKLAFHNRFGVEEYYVYDPEGRELVGYQRQAGSLQLIESIDGWVSPRLGITFVLKPAEPDSDLPRPELQILYPDGKPFLSFVELAQHADWANQRADREHERAEQLAQELQALKARFGLSDA